MGEPVRFLRLAGPLVFVTGVAALAVGFLENQATLSLFVIFPVITATGGWSVLGIALMVAGFFLSILSWPRYAESQPAPAPVPEPSQGPTPSAPGAPARRWGGVVFLGPVPVVFGSDQRVTQWMLILGVALFVALLVLTVIALRGI